MAKLSEKTLTDLVGEFFVYRHMENSKNEYRFVLGDKGDEFYQVFLAVELSLRANRLILSISKSLHHKYLPGEEYVVIHHQEVHEGNYFEDEELLQDALAEASHSLYNFSQNLKTINRYNWD